LRRIENSQIASILLIQHSYTIRGIFPNRVEEKPLAGLLIWYGGVRAWRRFAVRSVSESAQISADHIMLDSLTFIARIQF